MGQSGGDTLLDIGEIFTPLMDIGKGLGSGVNNLTGRKRQIEDINKANARLLEEERTRKELLDKENKQAERDAINASNAAASARPRRQRMAAYNPSEGLETDFLGL